MATAKRKGRELGHVEGIGRGSRAKKVRGGGQAKTDRVVRRKGANGHLIYVASLDIPHIAKKCVRVCERVCV